MLGPSLWYLMVVNLFEGALRMADMYMSVSK